MVRGDGGISDPHALDSLAGGVFVGRQREMGELKAALEDALSGRGRLLTLVGEPGIGKTRTALELATYAGLRQAQVLWGRCYEGEGAPPYWPWVQAIRSYVRDVDPEQLRSEMGAGAADIAEVVSDVREQLPGLDAPPQLEPEQARFRLFDSITAFLKNAGQRKPLVLVLDDLHWADHPSLLLLEFVARELGNARVLVIGAYRDMELSRQHPLSRTLGELTRERLFQRVLLRGLDQGDVGRFIELVSGIDPPPGLTEAVHRQTEGNPLFVTEVVRLLVQEGELTQDSSTAAGRAEERDSWSVRIPEGVREVIGRRLDRLSEQCNETLTIASVIGREFTLENLGSLIEDLTGDRLLEVLEEALSARVIEELPRAVGRYQFTHALIQETLAGELSTTRVVRLHARIAESLEESYGEEADGHAAELAYHFAEAEAVVGSEKLVYYSLLAGERALAAYAHEDALTHFEKGLAARGIDLSGNEAAPDEEAAALLFGLARAQQATLQRPELGDAFATMSRAYEYYAEAGNIPLAVAAAEFPIGAPGLLIPGVAELTVRALTLVPADSHEAGRLLSRFGGMDGSHYDGTTQLGREEALTRALTIARREGDSALELRTLVNTGRLIRRFHRHQEGLDILLQAIGLARHNKDLYSEVVACYWAALAHSNVGDLEGMRLTAVAGLQAAERLHDRPWLAVTIWAGQLVAKLEGAWQTVRDLGGRGLAVSPQESRILYTRSLGEYESGEFEQAEGYLEKLLEAMRQTSPGINAEYSFASCLIPMVARITGNSERLGVAEEAAQAVLSSVNTDGITEFNWFARSG
ncbi:MAG: AAA family ATPase, partial [Dehalococcoidia bacterium]